MPQSKPLLSKVAPRDPQPRPISTPSNQDQSLNQSDWVINFLRGEVGQQPRQDVELPPTQQNIELIQKLDAVRGSKNPNMQQLYELLMQNPTIRQQALQNIGDDYQRTNIGNVFGK